MTTTPSEQTPPSPAPDPHAASGWSAGALAYPLAVVLLGIALALVSFRLLDLREELRMRAPGVRAQGLESLLHESLTTADGETVVPAETGHDLVLLVALTPYDCATCFEELHDLAVIDEMRPDLAVYALMAYASPEEARQTGETFGLPFDIIPDADGTLSERLAVPQTPWKIVWSVPEGRVLFEDPRSMEAVEREAFLLRVSTL